MSRRIERFPSGPCRHRRSSGAPDPRSIRRSCIERLYLRSSGRTSHSWTCLEDYTRRDWNWSIASDQPGVGLSIDFNDDAVAPHGFPVIPRGRLELPSIEGAQAPDFEAILLLSMTQGFPQRIR